MIFVKAFGSSLSLRNLAIVQAPWGVISNFLCSIYRGLNNKFPNSVSHRSDAFLSVIRPILLVTQIKSVSRTGSRVSCYSFLSLILAGRYSGLNV